uniref:Uncharacterized protein n=1 Tax=Plectus sambesii TaxID=2011161 RepID=A0A914WF67_9BILA
MSFNRLKLNGISFLLKIILAFHEGESRRPSADADADIYVLIQWQGQLSEFEELEWSLGTSDTFAVPVLTSLLDPRGRRGRQTCGRSRKRDRRAGGQRRAVRRTLPERRSCRQRRPSRRHWNDNDFVCAGG